MFSPDVVQAKICLALKIWHEMLWSQNQMLQKVFVTRSFFLLEDLGLSEGFSQTPFPPVQTYPKNQVIVSPYIHYSFQIYLITPLLFYTFVNEIQDRLYHILSVPFALKFKGLQRDDFQSSSA